MASDTVQQIKDRLSIVDVVSQYVTLQRAGSSLRTRCPFHAERTPSFHVSPDRGTYHCFGCGVGGDIFSFVEAIEGIDFKGALKILAEKAGVEIVYSRGSKEQKDEKDRLFELMETVAIFYQSRLTPEAKKYLKERGLSEQTIKEFRVGWAGSDWTEAVDHLKEKKFTEKEIVEAGVGKKGDRSTLDKFRNRIMFPISDSAGRVIAFSGRIFGEDASPEAPKYLNSPETPLFHKSRILYGFDKAKLPIRKLGCAVLVEGQMDLLMSHQAGWGNTVAVSGTAFTEEHAALIHRMTENLVLALDADEAGIKATGRAARAALRGGLNVKVAQIPGGKDPADYILKEGEDAWKKVIRDSKDIITFLLDVLEAHAKAPDAFRRSVEQVVLPFLSDIRSPIAREQYIQEIAKRLHVSAAAVQEAFAKVPKSAAAQPAAPAPKSARQPVMNARARQAYGILLWQGSLNKPQIDIKKYTEVLKKSTGEIEFGKLEEMDKKAKEALAFAVEKDYEKTPSLQRDVDELLRVVDMDRERAEHAEATEMLREAEAKGDEKAVDILKKRIAKRRHTV